MILPVPCAQGASVAGRVGSGGCAAAGEGAHVVLAERVGDASLDPRGDLPGVGALDLERRHVFQIARLLQLFGLGGMLTAPLIELVKRINHLLAKIRAEIDQVHIRAGPDGFGEGVLGTMESVHNRTIPVNLQLAPPSGDADGVVEHGWER